jgi:hypothetical protein
MTSGGQLVIADPRRLDHHQVGPRNPDRHDARRPDRQPVPGQLRRQGRDLPAQVAKLAHHVFVSAAEVVVHRDAGCVEPVVDGGGRGIGG